MTSKSEKTRAMIINEASVLFNTKGYYGTSISDIMEATGLTKGGIYGNFKKEGDNKIGVKEEIAIAAFLNSVEIVNREVMLRTKVITDTLDKLKAVVYFYKERIFDFPVEGGCPLMNTIVEADENLPSLFQLVKKEVTVWQKKIVHTISKGIQRNEIKADIDAEEFATFFIGSIEGGLLLTKVHKDVKYFEVMAQAVIKRINEIRK